MTKFATKGTATLARPKPVIKTKTQEPTTVTAEGAPGFERKAKGELFLLAASNMVSEDTFYEKAEDRDARFEELIHKVVSKDPAWVAGFVPYLRNEMNMRTASLVMAAEYVKAGGPKGRSVVSGAIQRADEPSVMLAYWMSKYGKKFPAAIKRGVADAAVRLYNERSFIKWDSDNLVPRFGDVIELVHPKGSTPWQHDLFKFAIDKRHNREDLARNTESLSVIRKFRELMALPVNERRPLLEKAVESGDLSAFENVGLTWENLSGWLQGPMDARAWEAIIPQMGYMALIRNLRNFDDANISPDARAKVIAKLTNPDEVAKSRQLPLRFLSAFKNVEGAHWVEPLEIGLNLTLQNVPSLKGKTLILVDISGSMDSPFSGNTKGRTFRSGTAKYPTLWEAAALFGSALAVRAEKADLVAFESYSHVIDFRQGGSILKTTERFGRNLPHGGTNGHQALAKHFANHDRIVYLTDEAFHPGTAFKSGAEMFVFNLAGYKTSAFPSDRVWTAGGLSDRGFKFIEMMSSHRDGTWPWQSE